MSRQRILNGLFAAATLAVIADTQEPERAVQMRAKREQEAKLSKQERLKKRRRANYNRRRKQRK